MFVTLAAYATAMGNVHYLPKGDFLVGWGTITASNITEVKPDGTQALAMTMGGSNVTYRGYRFPWHGYPTWPPVLVAQPAANDLTLTFSWNGATETQSYRVYSGDTATPGNLLAVVGNTGFETSLGLPDAAGAACYYQVVPVDGQGSAGRPSPVVVNPARASCASAGADLHAWLQRQASSILASSFGSYLAGGSAILNKPPWGSASAASRPKGVSSILLNALPPFLVTAATESSALATAK
jgi:hypothetical protein